MVLAQAASAKVETSERIVYLISLVGMVANAWMVMVNSTRVKRGSLAAGVALFALAGCSGAPAMHVEEAAAVEPPGIAAEPAPYGLIPVPASVRLGEDHFTLGPATPIHYTGGDADVAMIAGALAAMLPVSAAGPRAASAVTGAPRTGAISLLLDSALDSLGPEGYSLVVARDGVVARAPAPAGLFYAVQTLRQLLPADIERSTPLGRQSIRAVTISDRPRFEWRGAMLDVARHFLPPADVKRYVDLMALYKLNRLHLHLSDDQGWRIEIKSWPNLARHGGSTAVGGGRGGFYTQAEYADIVEHARRRFVTVVPEIDMPGHTNAALASYAELNCDGRARPLYTGIRVGFSSLCPSREVTYRFVDDVVREISALTPGPWFHVGGDEVKTLSARQYAGFMERVQAIVRSHGKSAIGWGEIAGATLHPTTIVQYWQPNTSAAAAIRQNARFIMSPANKVYLDMKYDASTKLGLRWAGYVGLRTSYDWNPSALIPGIGERAVLGVEAPLWSETLVTLADFEHLAFPRLAAVAEVAWSPQAGRVWGQFKDRLAAQSPRWSALGVNFFRSPDIPWH